MGKILGIDTGTNSLGWAIVEKNGEEYHLLDKGVNIFQEGVKIEKGIESSKAAERTMHKHTRLGYYRRKLRKLRLLRILSDNHLCPPLSTDELSAWRLKKVYPVTPLFMEWQSTDDKEGKNPYAYRHKCLHEKLDLDNLTDRYTLGRALYHLNQRRGFLSNRKDQNNDEEGKVKGAISSLTQEMQEAGCEYLGDYFYKLYNSGKKIRNHYTARKEHYLKEFNAICDCQGLDDTLRKNLEKAIFFQRPLKSQKGQVGHCVFEKNKPKCPSSHPLFEEFRMLSFLNNVKVRTPKDDALRPLTDKERELLKPLFMRKSKREFKFEDIAKKIAGKQGFAFYKEHSDMPYVFNYPMDTSVSGCPVTTHLRDIFGDDWVNGICEVYTRAEGKTELQIINDVWHALCFYSDEDKLAEFAKTRLQLDEETAQKFCKVHMPSEYASLSLKAINKILPYLRRGLIYSHAAFLGNLGELIPAYEWSITEKREVAISCIIREMERYDIKTDPRTLEVCIKEYLRDRYNISTDMLKKLYHPSMMETYPRQRSNDDGIYQLGSPRISSVRNPMAMRSMFRLRKLVNRLLQEGKIDPDTEVHIEFARELNDANKRWALAKMTKDNQTERDNARKAIIELYRKETGQDIEPKDIDILKYLLWKEQDHTCLYTGKNIGIADFIGSNPKYDIEHTIPRSLGGDSTRMNLTLCDSRYNRDVKKAQLPAKLTEHKEILERIEYWKKKYEDLDKQIMRMRTAGATTKNAKDSIIQRRHLLKLQRDYWRGKYKRFTMTEVPEGFSRSQGTDISIISKYARLYLKSVFHNVYTVKGLATSDFRKIWGIQDEYSKKERVNHVHHCIDAIVIACIGLGEYGKLGAYYHDEENTRWYGASKTHINKPWPTFVEDIKQVEQEILVSHYTPDNMPKQGRQRVKRDGKVIKVKGKVVMAKGDAARGSLHNDTYYGAIEVNGKVRYVRRIVISQLEEKDIKNIVDETVKAIIEKAVADKGFKNAMASTIWMNEEKQIPIKKVRCFAPSVTNPLHIRKQRDKSEKEYKQQFHVANDRNYLMALYIGCDAKGKEKRDFELVNMLEASAYFKASNDKECVGHQMVPIKSKHGYPLAYTLKIGTMVLLYEKTPEEVREATTMERNKRLYKVTGIALSPKKSCGKVYMFCSITLRFHEEARLSGELKASNGEYKQDALLRPVINLYHTQLRALIQGYDFEINELGEITFKTRK